MKNNRTFDPPKSALFYFDEEWNYTWSGNANDYGYGLAVNSSETIYVVGSTWSQGAGAGDMILVSFNSSGGQNWNVTWGGWDLENGRGIAVNSSGDIYVAGTTSTWAPGIYSDIMLLKYNSSGALQWSRMWGGYYSESAWGIAVDSSGGVYVTGLTHSWGAEEQDVFLIKYNSSGAIQWNCTWGGSDNDWAFGVKVDSYGDIYVTGHTTSFTVGHSDIFLLKYNSSGALNWSRTWGINKNEYSRGIAVDSDDNVYIVGDRVGSVVTANDLILVKYNRSGVEQWNSTWDKTVSHGHSVAVDSSDNIYVVGDTFCIDDSIKLFIVKYSNMGEKIVDQIIGVNSSGQGVVVDPNDNIYIAGYREPENHEDIWLLKYKCKEDLENPSVEIYNYDNQAEYDTGYINVQVNVTDNLEVKGPVKIEFYEPDDSVIGLFDMNNPNGNLWNYTWSVSGYPLDDDYNFRIFANDTSNNLNDTTIGYFAIIDSTNPMITEITPIDGNSFERGVNIQINVTITDYASSIVNAIAMINASTPFNITMTPVTSNWTCTWDNTSLYAKGNYKITVWAKDARGNINQTESIVITIFEYSTTPPPGDGGGGSGNGDGGEPSITFGNYFLLFAIIAIIGLVIYCKKYKKLSSKF